MGKGGLAENHNGFRADLRRFPKSSKKMWYVLPPATCPQRNHFFLLFFSALNLWRKKNAKLNAIRQIDGRRSNGADRTWWRARCTGRRDEQGQRRIRSWPLDLGKGWSRSFDGEGRPQRSLAYQVQSRLWDLNNGRSRLLLGEMKAMWDEGSGEDRVKCGPLICKDQRWIFTEKLHYRALWNNKGKLGLI